MRKPFFITLLVTALLAWFGCSSDGRADEGQADTGKTVQKADKMAATAQPTDLAQKRTPVRSAANPIVTMETDLGNMTLELFRDVAPAHADSFVARTKDKFYEGTIFHRVIDGFMIQGGDPKGTGTGNAGYSLKAEFSDLPHVEGTLSMARSRDPNSASCQFFICLGRAAYLDHQYTVFGQLLKGYDVLHKIGKVEVAAPANNPGEKSRPVQDIHIKHLFLSDAEGKPLQTPGK